MKAAELHVAVGAHALGALDEREQVEFEHHLAGCPACAAELAEFQETAARLASAVAVAPPPQLRESVLAAASRTVQDRPVVHLHRGAPWRRRVPLLVAAAAAVAVLGGVGAYLAEHQRADEMADNASREAAVLAAADVVLSKNEQRGTEVKVWSSQSMDQAVVVLAGVPPLESSDDYQMWAVSPEGAPRSLAVMESEEVAGASSSRLVDDLGNASQLAVTVEPDGGSLAPSSPPVLSVQLG